MVKLASARDFRTYGPGLTKNRLEYINAGLYLIASILLLSGLTAQLSSQPRLGLLLIIAALAFILLVNLHDLFAHLAGIDFQLHLMTFDLQLAFVEFAVPLLQMLGTLLAFLGVLFLFIQVYMHLLALFLPKICFKLYLSLVPTFSYSNHNVFFTFYVSNVEFKLTQTELGLYLSV